MSSANPALFDTKWVFEPGCLPSFARDLATESKSIKSAQEIFYTLTHTSERSEELRDCYDFLNQQLADAKTFSIDKVQTAADLNIVNRNPLKSVEILLLQAAPICLTELCWLENVSQAATSFDPSAVEIMAIYLRMQQGRPFKNLFQAELLAHGFDLPNLASLALPNQTKISAAMFNLASTQLALAQFPRSFFPELLGFTRACFESYTFLQAFEDVLSPMARYFQIRYDLLKAQLPALNTLIDLYLKFTSDEIDATNQRIENGSKLYHYLNVKCVEMLKIELKKPDLTNHLFVELLQQKARYAVGHHRSIQLGGKNLDEWFKQSPFPSNEFLCALRESEYFNKHNPEQSRFLKLFEFNGPMFGVLNTDALEVVKHWLVFGENAGQRVSEVTCLNVETPREQHTEVKQLQDFKVNNSNRDIYYSLLNIEFIPNVLPLAKQRASKVLRQARLFSRMPFDDYSHSAFETFVESLYRREVKAYTPIGDKPKLSKQTYIWGIMQFAPTILVDGSWLQNINKIRDPSLLPITQRLLQIFSDELGGGVIERNHPYIYQRLLDSENIHLPPLHTMAFSENPGFLESAFDLPVYLMAISQFPNLFLPEILGLNLAIELSGLGNGYLRLTEALRYWEIDPSIVNVHISIDNLASGHAALAKTAIQLYLDYLGANQGRQAVNDHWRRVYSGYRSLSVASWRFKMALVTAYFCKGSIR